MVYPLAFLRPLADGPPLVLREAADAEELVVDVPLATDCASVDAFVGEVAPLALGAFLAAGFALVADVLGVAAASALVATFCAEAVPFDAAGFFALVTFLAAGRAVAFRLLALLVGSGPSYERIRPASGGTRSSIEVSRMFHDFS